MAHPAASLFDDMAQHHSYLYRYALAKVRHRSAAEDLVQETLLAAVESHASFKGQSTLLTWLAAILKHKIVDWRRRESRNPSRPSERQPSETQGEYDGAMDSLFDADGSWINPVSSWPDPAQAFETQAFWEVFEECLATLSPAAARAFYLREFEGKSTAAICSELDISESNCWVLIHRARMALRRQLDQRWFQARDNARPARSVAMPKPRRGAESAANRQDMACSPA